jgi:tetratricopeptide (TPR) repeat protein
MMNTAEALTQRGISLENGGEEELAMQFYLDAIAIDPHHVTAHINLGAQLHKRGNVREALAHARIAVENEPEHRSAWFNLANALEELGQVEEAIIAYAKSTEMGFVDAHYNLAILFEAKRQPRKALLHWGFYCERAPKGDSYYKHASTRVVALLRSETLRLVRSNPAPAREPGRAPLEIVYGRRP